MTTVTSKVRRPIRCWFADPACVPRRTNRSHFALDTDTAVKIGSDVLQISSYGAYMLNGVSQATLPAKMADLFQVTHTQVNDKQHVFDIEVDDGEHIIISTFKDM